jgi:hypothetical protein
MGVPKERLMLDEALRNQNPSQAPVALTCNPSYLGDRGQENHGSKPALRLYLKNIQI